MHSIRPLLPIQFAATSLPGTDRARPSLGARHWRPNAVPVDKGHVEHVVGPRRRVAADPPASDPRRQNEFVSTQGLARIDVEALSKPSSDDKGTTYLSRPPHASPAPNGSAAGDNAGIDPPRRAGSNRRRAPGLVRVAQVVVAAAVLGLCTIGVWWWATGGKWSTVHNPSMGSAAPVGTLLWVKPTDISNINVGDIVTFRTPTTIEQGAAARTSEPIVIPSQTITHRVVGRYADGTLQTKGDLDGAADPWHVDQQHLVGQVTGRWWAFGWLIKALPLLLLGGMVLWMLTGSPALRRARKPLRMIGAAALVTGAFYLYAPLFKATQTSLVPFGSGARVTYVGTGLMPVKLEAAGAPSVLVHYGEQRSIVVPQRDQSGQYRAKVVPRVPWETWPVVAGVLLMPLVWWGLVGAGATSSRRRRRRRATSAQPVPQLQTS